ncbi:hypothetical protein ACP4OV_006922 [Aristida adscensionis]
MAPATMVMRGKQQLAAALILAAALLAAEAAPKPNNFGAVDSFVDDAERHCSKDFSLNSFLVQCFALEGAKAVDKGANSALSNCCGLLRLVFDIVERPCACGVGEAATKYLKFSPEKECHAFHPGNC